MTVPDPSVDPTEILDRIHNMMPDEYGLTLQWPLRGRPRHELTRLQDLNATGICNLCGHLLELLGSEWRCVKRCRCEAPCRHRECCHCPTMMGCIPKRGGWDDEEWTKSSNNE